MSSINITLNKDGRGTVIIGGHDVSQFVKSVEVSASPKGTRFGRSAGSSVHLEVVADTITIDGEARAFVYQDGQRQRGEQELDADPEKAEGDQ